MPPLPEAAIGAALSHATEGVCRPLRMRVEQVLAAPDLGLVPLFKLGALFQFYSGVLLPSASGGGLLPADAVLCQLIADLLGLSRKVCCCLGVFCVCCTCKVWVSLPTNYLW